MRFCFFGKVQKKGILMSRAKWVKPASRLLKTQYAECPDERTRTLFQALQPLACGFCGKEIAEGEYFTRRKKKNEEGKAFTKETCRVCSPFEIRHYYQFVKGK